MARVAPVALGRSRPVRLPSVVFFAFTAVRAALHCVHEAISAAIVQHAERAERHAAWSWAAFAASNLRQRPVQHIPRDNEWRRRACLRWLRCAWCPVPSPPRPEELWHVAPRNRVSRCVVEVGGQAALRHGSAILAPSSEATCRHCLRALPFFAEASALLAELPQSATHPCTGFWIGFVASLAAHPRQFPADVAQVRRLAFFVDHGGALCHTRHHRREARQGSWRPVANDAATSCANFVASRDYLSTSFGCWHRLSDFSPGMHTSILKAQ